MNSKESLLARFNKPNSCFLCKANVKNRQNFCMKCTAISKSSTPVPKLTRKKTTKKTRYFYIKQSSPSHNLKKTACFNNHDFASSSVTKSLCEPVLKDRSVDQSKTSQFTNRPSSSIYFKSQATPVSLKSKKKQRNSQKKFFRLNATPIPELKSQIFDQSSYQASFVQASSYNFHKNTVSALLMSRGIIYTAGLDYLIKGHDLANMQNVYIKKGHSKGITNLCLYKNLLVSSGKDGTVRWWNDRCVFLAKAHLGIVKSLCSNDSLWFTGNESVKIWQDTKVVSEYTEKVNHLAALGNNFFLTAGKDLKIWDVRCWNSCSLVSSDGPFNYALPWDDSTLWTAGQIELKKWDIRMMMCLERLRAEDTVSLCKAKNQLFSAGRSLSSFGKPVLRGCYTSLLFDDDLSLMFAGDRLGTLHIFKI